MASLDDPVNTILNAFRSRSIPTRRVEVASAFNSRGQAVKDTNWVTEHLSHNTLLSPEEITLYSALESTGTLRNHDLNIEAYRPVLDDDFRKAIELLDASTTATQKQTRILTTQCDNINKLLCTQKGLYRRRTKDLEGLHQRHESRGQNINSAISQLSHEITMSLKGESEKLAADGKRILSSLTARVKEDDRKFASVERLASGVKPIGDDAFILEQASGLSTILAQCVAEGIQYRLDRVYIEAILAGQLANIQGRNEAESKISAALERELDSLYPEIDILSEMSAKQQFTEPILRELQNHHGQLYNVSHHKLNHIVDMVSEMTLSMESLTKALQERESYCGTFEAFSTTYRTEADVQFHGHAASRRVTLKRLSTQQTLMPTPSAKHVNFLPESQIIATVLRRTGLPYESVFQSEDDGRATVLSEKRHHMTACLHNYRIAADSPLIAEMTSSDRAAYVLSSSLNIDSRFSNSLANTDHKARLSELGFQLGDIQDKVAMIDLDILYRRDKNRENFMKRWD
ncbi:hypothetical protein BDV25DRAFT_163826 [Aspergillus avenaceus]|uniref:Uncharacterized protein n=1 Tax=Aspergillus avenaceus TaxID=36643 RepID=A0A5N6TI70_ASPAV|nr:hypothetical protein BDV25DRAFT_163826 [Aspergillus avenaceus]